MPPKKKTVKAIGEEGSDEKHETKEAIPSEDATNNDDTHRESSDPSIPVEGLNPDNDPNDQGSGVSKKVIEKDPRGEGYIIHLPNGQTMYLNNRDFLALYSGVAATTQQAASDESDDIEPYRVIQSSLITLEKEMPLGIIYEASTGEMRNPHYLAMTADGSYLAIINDVAFPLETDNGVLRYHDNRRILLQDFDFIGKPDVVQYIMHWNWTVIQNGSAESIIVGYREISKMTPLVRSFATTVRYQFAELIRSIGEAFIKFGQQIEKD